LGKQLVIAGFHRSGTSLAAGFVHRAGLFLGDELIGVLPSNPYGHFEDVDVVRLHNQILADNDLTWLVGEPLLPVINEEHWRRLRELVEKRGASHRLWGFKDPRVCLFMMVWKYLMPDMKVLLVYRHYADSTYSLAQRHSSDLFLGRGQEIMHRSLFREPDLALRMWLVHNRYLLAFARRYPEDTLVVSHGMVQDGFPLTREIERRWSLGLLRDVPVGEVYDAGVTFRRPGKQPVSDQDLIPQVTETWEALEGLAREAELEMLDGLAALPATRAPARAVGAGG
jgi:hypothetical protein